jgi:antitoxin component YwqK of YwqJK toxin-antitoxin module
MSNLRKIKIMNKSFSLLFIILFLTSCESKVNQTELNFKEGFVHYKGKLYTGKVFDSYPSGEIQFEGEYNNGIKYGDWITYFQNGNIESEEHYFFEYSNNLGKVLNIPKPYKVWKRYYPNGKLTSIQSWDNYGIRNGITELFDDNGFKTYTVNYIDDYKDGNEFEYYEPYYKNGKAKYQLKYKITWPTGIKTEYFKNGKIKSTITYVNWYKDGIEMGYNSQGMLTYKYLYTTKIPEIIEERKTLYENAFLMNNYNYYQDDKFPEDHVDIRNLKK